MPARYSERSPMRTTTRTDRAAGCACCLLRLRHAAAGPDRSPRDPWERMNRTTYKFNDALDKAVLRPVAARLLKRAVPQLVTQTGISNFIDQPQLPGDHRERPAAGAVRAFGNDTGRLLMNTTFGLGGLFDPATTRRPGQERPRLRPDARQVGRARAAPTSCCRSSGPRTCAMALAACADVCTPIRATT